MEVNRLAILKRDKFKCQRCKKKFSPEALVVHHKDFKGYTMVGINDMYAPDNSPKNLETLCTTCHGIRHSKAPKVIKPACPACGSKINRYRRQTDELLCRVCGHSWKRKGVK